MNNQQESKVQNIEDTDSIDLKKVFSDLKGKWYWFLISLIIGLFAAYFYVSYTPPVYNVKARLLVNDNDGGGMGNQASALMDLGSVLGSKSSVDNESEILKTRFLIEQVVNEMHLNIVYSYRSGFSTRELDKSPFELQIVKGVDSIKLKQIEIHKLNEESVKVVTEDFEKDVKFNEQFPLTGVGTIKLIRSPSAKFTNADYRVNVNSVDATVTALLKQLTVEVTNKQVTIVDLDLVYPLQAKGERILNTLIRQYINGNLVDKNIIAESTYKFIQERINIIASDLGDVENKVESFKQTNRLADMSEQSKLLIQNTGGFSNDLVKTETQISVLNDLESYLKDETKNKRVFPTSLLPSDMIFAELLNQYNSLLIERDRQLLSVTESSPFIQNLDSQIAGLRKGILSNIQNTKNTYIITRNKLNNQINKADNKIGDIPQIEKNYLKLARNQKIKEELYIFLMQKAEETAISKTANIAVAKTIDPPKAEIYPISPKKKIVYPIAALLSLIIPFLIILGTEFFNTTVLRKEDITSNTVVPIIGEISHNLTHDNLIVSSQGRSAISEQFRALRTNLSFYLKSADQKVILLTSSMSGEGKSFTAINLGNILAITGKKVLLMELDLRKPGLSGKLNIANTIGFSNYIISPNLNISDIIKPLEINSNMSILPSGPLPPNPAELLLSEKTEQLFDHLKAQFDFIIIDAPPVGIIADAQLLSRYADAVMYLVREGVTQKTQLSIVQDLYANGKMNNLGIVVNDISSQYFGYGYGYGNYGQEIEEGFFKKLLRGFRG